MKFISVCVALVCANLYFCRAGNTRNQKVCSTPNTPININVHGDGGHGGAKGEKGAKGDVGEKGEKGASCNCPLQDPNKPSAHIEGANYGSRTYRGTIVIKDWSLSAPHSHLLGGMKYIDGKLTVPIGGRYYIYAQIYYYNNGRVHVRVNNKVVSMTQPIKTATSEGALYAGGVFNLKAGDAITLTGGSWPTAVTKVYMYTFHCYFGAFLI